MSIEKDGQSAPSLFTHTSIHITVTQPLNHEENVMKRLVVLAVFAMVAVMVQFDYVMAQTKDHGVDAPSMKQVLLNPKGFDMVWSCGGRSGWSRVFFQDDGKKIVADITVVDIKDVDINNPEYFGPERCTTDTELTDKGIIFNGCSSASRNIPLTYDPGNKKTPFKGSGPNCPKIELSPR